MKQDLEVETHMPRNAQVLVDLEEDDKLERGNNLSSYFKLSFLFLTI